MVVRLRPGRVAADARGALESAHTAALNARGGGHRGYDLLNAYIDWTSDAVRTLRPHISDQDIQRLVLTRRYWALTASTEATAHRLALLVDAELDERAQSLEEAIREIDQFNRAWPHGELFVPDTSALIHGPKLWDWDPAAEFALGEVAVDIVIPLIVIDELDALKESSREHTRYRARSIVKWLSKELSHETVTLRERRGGAPKPHGAIAIHLLADPMGHRRLPLADDEIVDRAVVLAAMTGRGVRLYTNDFGQVHRARRAGLKVSMVAEPIYDVDLRRTRHQEQEGNRAAKAAQRRRQSQPIQETTSNQSGPDPD